MQSEIITKFSELRKYSTEIIELASDHSGVDKKKISISTAINNDLGIQGDDVDDLLIALHKKYNLELHGLNFYDYFIDEGEISFGAIFYLPKIPFLILVLFFVYPFSRSKAKKTWKKINNISLHKKPDFTIGDLITSKLENRFVKREERVFRFSA